MFGKKITVKELKEKLDNLHENEIVVDVRSSGEFAEMRIDSDKVENIDVNSIFSGRDKLKGKTVYLICNSGNRSGMAQMLLKANGIDAINVAGGMLDWVSNKFPTKSDYN